MFSNTEGLRSTSAICKKLAIDEPKQDIIKSSLKFIHKIIEAKKPQQITAQLRIPSRRSAKVYMRDGTRSARANRSPIDASIELYNAIPPKFRSMRHKKLKNQLKKVTIKYSPFD